VLTQTCAIGVHVEEADTRALHPIIVVNQSRVKIAAGTIPAV